MNKPVIALLLPGYSPNLAWMTRALNASQVVLDDRHPFSRKGQVHRTKIRTPDGHQWLSIPFVGDDRRKPIDQLRIDDRRPWLKHHLQALEYNYRNSLYFDFYEPEVRSDLETAANFELLIDALRHLMKRQWIYLQLPEFPKWLSGNGNDTSDNSGSKGIPETSPISPDTDYYQARLREITGISKTERISVWQEPDSRNYQKPHPDAVHPAVSLPEYRQHFSGFVPGCGVLDLLFEYGPDAWQILDQLKPEK